MTKSTRFIFPLKVMKWETLKTENGQNLKPGPEMNAIGYIPVYEDIQSLCDDHGTGAEYGTFLRRDVDETLIDP